MNTHKILSFCLGEEKGETNMSDKVYLTRRTEYLLQKAIDSEIERIKDLQKNDPYVSIDHCCTEIGLLVALKAQAKDLIDKL